MSYPTLEQYNEALQYPQLALSDPDLKQGSIATTGLGLPLALCGGFALTYTIKGPSKKYAVRCFHKQSNALEKRYSSIATRLRTLQSSYFIDFEFQPKGILVGGKSFPVVKMAWASGITLGEFLEQNYRNPSTLHNLVTSLRVLSKYLESQGMAHGDIQPGNVMVADTGKKLQLIDYDGLFVNDLRSLGSAELGHRNFQHPKRSASSWDPSLDRFSFISIDLALRAIASHPEFWTKTHSDGDTILFKANDFADPNQSAIFTELIGLHSFSEDAKNFAAICCSSFDKTPTLEEFITRRNIPSSSTSITQSSTKQIQYLSAFPILDAANYSLCLGFVGEKVELVGQIVEVKQDTTRYGKPYVFINFGHWKGHTTKINIWSEGLTALKTKPTDSWIGKWITVVGLMEPPYINKRYKYSHLAISVTQGSQLHILTEKEAKFRLAGSSTRTSRPHSKTTNREILEEIKSTADTATTQIILPHNISSPSPTSTTTTTSPTRNQAILKNIYKNQATTPSTVSQATSYQTISPQTVAKPSQPTSYPNTTRTTPPSSSSKCFIATAIYGSDALETITLRQWRDRCLLPHISGRVFVSIYYRVSPQLVVVLSRSKFLAKITRSILDKFVIYIASNHRR